jgi:hypothetical protein
MRETLGEQWQRRHEETAAALDSAQQRWQISTAALAGLQARAQADLDTQTELMAQLRRIHEPLAGTLQERWGTNGTLSSARAAAVVDRLQRLGVAPHRFTAMGYSCRRRLNTEDFATGKQGRAQPCRLGSVA